jgi:hypothetical protein
MRRNPAELAKSDDVDRIVTLHHRRRGWAWVGFGSLIGLVAYFILGVALFDNLSGAAETVSFVPIFVLLALMLVGLITALVDTVRLRRFDAEARRTAKARVDHHPVYAHAHRYPPRHRGSWVFALLMLVAMTGLTVIFLPGEVNSVAYLTGVESHDTFNPVNYAQACSRGGCSTVTEGFLSNSGANVTWDSQVPLGRSFPVRVPVWNWGIGHSLISSDGRAVVGLVIGLVLNAFSVIMLLTLFMLMRTMRKIRKPLSPAAAAAQTLPPPMHKWTPDMTEHKHYQVMPPAGGGIGTGREKDTN